MADTALVTGISGFVAKHVALELLRRGYHVRGTMRTMARVSGVRETLGAHGADLSRLEFVMADLEVASSWLKAAAGCRYVHHIASPFPLRQPRGREDLVPAARDGARAVLRAAFAADAERVVLTSSMVAMMYRAGRERVHLVRETDWTDADWPRLTPYVVSKTRAERAAWDIAAEHGAQDRLVAVNPGFVLGPALDKNIGASLQALAMILRGGYPALPRVSYPVVDVRDLAALHVAAMTAQVGGRRLIAAADTLSFADMAKILRMAAPGRASAIPTRILPDAAVRALAFVDPSIRTLRADLGVEPRADNAPVQRLAGVTFRSGEEAVRAAALSLIEYGLA